MLQKAIALDPDYVQAHFALGTALRKSGRPDEALREQRTHKLGRHPAHNAAPLKDRYEILRLR